MKDLVDRNLGRLTAVVMGLAIVAGVGVHVIDEVPARPADLYSHEIVIQCPEYYCTFRCYMSEMDRYVNQYDEQPDTGIERLAEAVMEGCQKIHRGEACLQKLQADSGDIREIYSGRVRVSEQPLCPPGAVLLFQIGEN